MGRGKREERLPPFFSLPIVPCALSIFRSLLFVNGISSGACAQERVSVNSNVLPFISHEWNHSSRRYIEDITRWREDMNFIF